MAVRLFKYEVYVFMKARIIREPRCVLLWRFTEKSTGYDALAHAARAYKLKIRCIGDGDLAAKVGDLCQGLPSPAFAPLIAVGDRPAMIVSGLRHDTGELGHFLDLVKAGGAEFPLRSMVTPTSKDWTLLQLLQELNNEHETVTGGKA